MEPKVLVILITSSSRVEETTDILNNKMVYIEEFSLEGRETKGKVGVIEKINYESKRV